MNSTWWSNVDTNSKALIIFQSLVIGGLIICNFVLFYVLELKNDYIPGLNERNNPGRNIVYYPNNRAQ